MRRSRYRLSALASSAFLLAAWAIPGCGAEDTGVDPGTVESSVQPNAMPVDPMAPQGAAGAGMMAPTLEGANPTPPAPVTPAAPVTPPTPPSEMAVEPAPVPPAIPDPPVDAMEEPMANLPVPPAGVENGMGGMPAMEEPGVPPAAPEMMPEPPVAPEEPVVEPEEEPPVAPMAPMDLPTDAKELVKTGNPGNEKLIAYADNEIGDPVIATEGTGQDRDITQPIVVPPGVTYDGKGEKLTPKGLGNGSQDESQKPMFILMPGANLSNVTIGKPGVEGVHMMGDNVLDHVIWEDVGEDAASIRSYFPGGKITISNGSARDAADKCFQCNSPCQMTVENFEARNLGKFIRQGGPAAIDVTLINVTVDNVKSGVLKCNTSACTLKHKNLKLTNGEIMEGPGSITEL